MINVHPLFYHHEKLLPLQIRNEELKKKESYEPVISEAMIKGKIMSLRSLIKSSPGYAM